MDEKVFDQPIRDRGISLLGFVVESVTLDDESNQKIDNYELSSNQFMQQGTLTGAYANAVQDAAKNEAGAMNGFLGVGMMNMASGGMIGGAVNNAMNPQAGSVAAQPYDPYANQAASQLNQAQQVASANTVANQNVANTVANQNVANTDASTNPTITPVQQQPATDSTATQFCPNCGTPSKGGNFCTNCGTKLK